MSPSTLHEARRIYKIASIPGDGIGPEVISAGIEVLRKLSAIVRTFELHIDHLDWGSDYYKKHGKYIPDGGVESLKKYDAIFFGSVGAPGRLLLFSTARMHFSKLCPCAASVFGFVELFVSSQ